MSPAENRVAITGLGVKSPGGTTVERLLDTVLAGRSVAAPVPELRERGAPVTFACRVPEFDLTPYLSRRDAQKLDRTTHLALAAALDAVAAAGLPTPLPDGSDLADVRAGVSVGTGVGGLGTAETVGAGYAERLDALPVFTVTRIMANAAASQIAMRTGFRGACNTYATACASGATAIGEGANKIRSGELDVVVAGGSDAPVTPIIMSAFHRIGALSAGNDRPDAASRPFDDARSGFVMGEGAAFMVLERWEHALARGATVLGELTGYAANCDAFHLVAPMPDGRLAASCMLAALAAAQLKPAEVGHVNAHGTSTPLNDRTEARAIHEVFGDAGPPVTAPKGVVGHLLGGAGALEAILALCFARQGVVPPVANFDTGTDAELIDLVAGAPRRIPVLPAISNSFGFGGHNACLVVTPEP